MQCVVFDMDGVLFDSEALVLRSWEQTAEIHGIPDVREVCLRCLGTNAAESRRLFLEKYGADFPYDTYKAEMSARYWENVGEGKLELKPGVREILDALRGRIDRSKPDPEIYLTACRVLGADPAETYAVEDSYNGIRSAAAAGMRPVMIPDLLPPTPEIESLTAKIFPSMTEFQQFLFS